MSMFSGSPRWQIFLSCIAVTRLSRSPLFPDPLHNLWLICSLPCTQKFIWRLFKPEYLNIRRKWLYWCSLVGLLCSFLSSQVVQSLCLASVSFVYKVLGFEVISSIGLSKEKCKARRSTIYPSNFTTSLPWFLSQCHLWILLFSHMFCPGSCTAILIFHENFCCSAPPRLEAGSVSFLNIELS